MVGVRGQVVVCRRWFRRRLPAALAVLIFIWVVIVINITFVLDTRRRRYDLLKEELAQIIGQHIQPLTREMPASTAHPNNNVADLDLDKEKVPPCEITEEEHKLFPQCRSRMEWMRLMWKSDPCYKAYGVDGSECSFLKYLGEVERWCPRRSTAHSAQRQGKMPETTASITTNFEGLMGLLKDPNPRKAYAWIRLRVTRLWPKWVQAIHSLSAKQDLSKRTQHKILLHLGLLTKATGWKFAEFQFKGGPLGELVQWSDLISVLYILGHQLTITSEVEQLVRLVSKGNRSRSSCQVHADLPVTLIYTDIVGLMQLKKLAGFYLPDQRCKLRVVDSFGTEPAYNHRAFAKKNNLTTFWGGLDLNPRQFFTMFPHSPDNSFMGFVVEHHVNSTGEEQTRKDIAVVYGKNDYMWKGKKAYLDVIQKYLQIHGTVDKNTSLPPYVINHGILPGPKLHQLLRQAKIFVGLGFPYEGPAPLEAIADGAVFLNPRFIPPHSSKNTKFFGGKPTQRQVTSQHPYAEMFIGKPHVHTINITNLTEIDRVVQEILQLNKFTGFLPYEYTEEGMLQRMNAYIQHQQFCNVQLSASKWPPPSAVTFVMGQTGQSCAQACWAKDLLCEPSYFPGINSEEALKNNGAFCTEVKHGANIYYPSVNADEQECTLQDDQLLFSCVGGRGNVSRLCPCRNYIAQQSALCKGCER